MSLLIVKEIHAAIRLLGMLLLNLPSYGVLETNDEMDFRSETTFVCSKHDGVRSLIIKLKKKLLKKKFPPLAISKETPYQVQII